MAASMSMPGGPTRSGPRRGRHPPARRGRPSSARSAAATRAEATAATDPGGGVGLLAVLDDDRHGESKGSAGHPTRALPPVEIDLPGGARSGSGGG